MPPAKGNDSSWPFGVRAKCVELATRSLFFPLPRPRYTIARARALLLCKARDLIALALVLVVLSRPP